MESNVVWTSTFIEKYYHVVQKQERHTGLDEYEGMQIMTIYIFMWTIPLKGFVVCQGVADVCRSVMMILMHTDKSEFCAFK